MTATPARDPGSPAIALACWIVIALILVDLAGPRLSMRPWFARPAPAGTLAPAPELAPPSALFTIAAQTTLFEVGRTRAEDRAGAASAALDQLRPLMSRPADQVGLAILAGDLDEALGEAVLDQASREIAEDSLAQEDLAALRSGTLTPEMLDDLTARYGWFGRLAGARGLDPSDPRRAGVLAAARRTFLVSAGFMFGLAIVGIVSVGLFVLGLVRLAGGKLRRSAAPPAPGGSVYLEAFAIFLVGLVVVQQVSDLIRPYSVVAADLARWSLLACVFWPRLRGADRERWRFATGLHAGRGLFREAIAGVMGYLACLPIIAIGIGITLLALLVQRRLGSESAMPSHPLGDMIAHSHSVWSTIALVMLAVGWAPLVEESHFRGALQHHLRGRLPAVLAWIVVGVIFAALHPQGLVAIPALASIGVTFSMLREWRGSLIAPMVAHALNNGAITALLFALTSDGA